MVRGMRTSSAFRAALAGMLAMAVCMGIGRFVYTPILPSMIATGTLDAAQAGLVAGANYLGYLVGALAASAGYFAPHRRRWFYFALALNVVTTAAMAPLESVAMMVAIRFLAGVASAFSMVFITAIVMAKLAEMRRPGLIAVHFAGVGVGIAGSAVLVSTMVAHGAGWRSLWLASAVAAGFAYALVAWLLLETTRETVPVRRARGEASASRLPLIVYIVGYGFFGFGYVITATFINTMAKSQPELAPVEPYVWIAVGLAIIPSIWFWNRIAARYSPAVAYATACLIEAVGVGLSVTIVSPVALLISALLLGATFVAVTALGLGRARVMAPDNAAGAIALMTASFGAGQAVGPVVAGWLFERSGDLFLASWFAVAALLVAVVLATFAERRSAVPASP